MSSSKLALVSGLLLAFAGCAEEEVSPLQPGPGEAGQLPPGVDGGYQVDGGSSNDGATGGDAANAATSAWCRVRQVFETHCNACHDGKGSAGTPMGLVNYADLTADSAAFPGSKIYERVGVRMHATVKPMPPQGGVSEAEQKLVDEWIAAGAPAAGSTDCSASTPDAGAEQPEWPADCEERYEFRANTNGQPFKVAAGREFYQDFTFPAPWPDGKVQAVAFRSITDNTKVLHHWILYQGSDSFLKGWSPGKNEEALPNDIGVYMPGKGNTLKLTVHYYNSQPGAKEELDSSGVEVCVTSKPRPKTAFTFPFTAVPNVPANAPMTTNTATCTVKSEAPVHLITSSPHMHRRGMHAKLEILRANGTTEVVHDRPFNFEEQTTTPIDVVLNSGDKVRTTCVYANTGGSATGFGTSTEQEMCFNFALYYPMCGMTCTGAGIVADIIAGTQGGGCPDTGGGLFGL